MADIWLSFGRNGIGQFQASISDGSTGFRIAGAKYDGMGTELLRAKIDARTAAEIRGYLDKLGDTHTAGVEDGGNLRGR